MSDIKPTAPLLIISPPTELTFKGPFTDVVTSELHLKNATNSNICFKIMTTAPRRYCVRPNNGVLGAEEDITVNVMLQPFEYDPQERPHKFMVQAMTAPPGEFDQEIVWKYSAAGSMINSQSYKLLGVFEMPISATTVSPKAAENATIKDTLLQEISHLKHKITMLEKEKTNQTEQKMSDIKPTAPETLLIISPPTELRFQGPLTDVVTSELHLKNATNSNICFKIMTTAPRRYCVRPNNGVLGAEEDITVNVMLQPFEYYPQKRPHKFMVQAMTAPPGEFDQETVWKYSAAGSLINGQSYKLLSVFEMPISATTDTKQLLQEISHLKHEITMLEKEKSGHNDSYIMTRDWKNSLQKKGMSDTIHSLVTIRDTNDMK